MRISDRASRIEPFYVMEVAKAASQLAREFSHTHRPMIFLNIGEPDFTAPPLVQEAAARAIHDVPIPSAFPALIRLLERPGLSDRLYIRAANAAFRQGDLGALLPFVRKVAPPDLRVQVMELLAEWERPSGRDRVLGHWRPLAPEQWSASV